MGMAASQARFLSLTARKTNVEFEGQQINQQRTSLSNESANYYSQLCNMVVPTPPSSEDFSKTTYSFSDGSETNTINALIAQPGGLYIVNYTQSYDTESVISNGSVVVVRNTNVDDEGNPLPATYSIGGTLLRPMRPKNGEAPSLAEIQKDPYLSTLTEQQLQDTLELESQYLGMLADKYGDQGWYVRYQLNEDTKTYSPVFYSATQVENADYSEKTGHSLSSIKSYVYGSTKENREILNAKARVEQDTSGRYMSIIIYETNADGTIKTDDGKEIGTEYELKTITQNDDRAYNDAVNKYNYDKAKYDQEINAINSKIEIIHGQDKDLELRLKQLDTEQNAISNEIDAVKKVISKNVDGSFKTFSA